MIWERKRGGEREKDEEGEGWKIGFGETDILKPSLVPGILEIVREPFS